MRRYRGLLRSAVVCAALWNMAHAPEATAGIIAGGSSLLSQADADQLEAWLGEGPITLTNIFTKSSANGYTAADFHAAVDDAGRTFTVIEVRATDYYAQGLDAQGHFVGFHDTIVRQVIGGFNPHSWDSSSSYHSTPDVDDRTAFLFNLTSGVMQPQSTSSPGEFQTYNNASYGPTFGGGHDLYTDFSLATAYTFTYSYGDGQYTSDIVQTGGEYPVAYYHQTLQLGTIEVFRIDAAAAAPSAVPEPVSLAVWSLMACVTGIGRRLKRSPAV